jgi:hypothetical protein
MAITGCPRRLLPSITRLGESNGTKGGGHTAVLGRTDGGASVRAYESFRQRFFFSLKRIP